MTNIAEGSVKNFRVLETLKWKNAKIIQILSEGNGNAIHIGEYLYNIYRVFETTKTTETRHT